MTKLFNFRKFKLSFKYLLFILFVFFGCLYQIIQITEVFLKFDTKIDVSFETKDQIDLKVRICKHTNALFRNSSIKSAEGMSPAQIYNNTFGFDQILINVGYLSPDHNYILIKLINYYDLIKYQDDVQLRDPKQLRIEKVISYDQICYQFSQNQIKIDINKNIKRKQILYFVVFHRDPDKNFHLFIDSDDNFLQIKGINFYVNKRLIKLINRWKELRN